MGHLFYNGVRHDFDDRVLAHLQAAIGAKLRRHENFFLTWRPTQDQGGGLRSIWLDNGVPMEFVYSGGRVPKLNREWVETLIGSSNTPFGLVVSPETFPQPGHDGDASTPGH